VVAYVTCSPVPAETRDVVTAVASSTPATEILDAPAVLSPAAEILDAPAVLSPAAEILDAPAVLPAVPDIRSPAPRFAQLWPHRHTTDAIFIALLRRTS
jgi:16S rRNA (cytosine967-C5)-methyltransferase